MRKKKKTGLLGALLKGFAKSVMSEPSKQHRKAIRKAKERRRKLF